MITRSKMTSDTLHFAAVRHLSYQIVRIHDSKMRGSKRNFRSPRRPAAACVPSNRSSSRCSTSYPSATFISQLHPRQRFSNTNSSSVREVKISVKVVDNRGARIEGLPRIINYPSHACFSGLAIYQAGTVRAPARSILGRDELNSGSGRCCFPPE